MVISLVQSVISDGSLTERFTEIASMSLLIGCYVVPLGWVVILVFAGPAYLVLKKFNKVNLVALLMVGTFAGLVLTMPSLVMGNSSWARGFNSIPYGVLFGASTSLVFWLLAVRAGKDA